MQINPIFTLFSLEYLPLLWKIYFVLLDENNALYCSLLLFHIFFVNQRQASWMTQTSCMCSILEELCNLAISQEVNWLPTNRSRHSFTVSALLREGREGGNIHIVRPHVRTFEYTSELCFKETQNVLQVQRKKWSDPCRTFLMILQKVLNHTALG